MVLGGTAPTLGVVLAAFVLTVTPELLRGFDEYRVLLFGADGDDDDLAAARPGAHPAAAAGLLALRKGSRAMTDSILRVEHLMMHFGGIKALNDVNLEVERGSITAPDRPQRRGQDHGV